MTTINTNKRNIQELIFQLCVSFLIFYVVLGLFKRILGLKTLKIKHLASSDILTVINL